MNMKRGMELIRDCANLCELCDRLNYIYDHRRPYWRKDAKMEEIIDVTSLPVYSNKEPEDTRGIYSWDDEWVIRFGDFGFYMDYKNLNYPEGVI